MKINYQHPALQYHDPVTGEYNEDLNEQGIINVESHYVVCSTCNGHGSHFRSDLDENNLVQMMYEDGDEDGIDSYYSGAYDQVCSSCNGNRVIAEPHLPEWANKLLCDWYESEMKYRSICRAEQRMGA